MSLIQEALKKVQGDPSVRSPLEGNPPKAGRAGRGGWPWRLIGVGVVVVAVLFLTMKLPGVVLGRKPASDSRPSATPTQPTTREGPSSQAASVPEVPSPSPRVAAAASALPTVAGNPLPQQPASPIPAAGSPSVVEHPHPAIPQPARDEEFDDEFARKPPRVEERPVPVPEVETVPIPPTAFAPPRESLITPVLDGKDHYYFNMGLFYQEQGQYTRAFEAYQTTVELNPFHAEAYNNLGILYEKVGDLHKAIQHYRKALAVDPEYVKAYNNLGVALIGRGELEEAAIHFERALDLNPKNLESYTNLGVIYRRRNLIPKAIRVFEAALSLDPGHPETHYNLALLMEGQGRIAEAVAHYRKFLANAKPHHRSVVAPVITRIRQLSQKTAESSARSKVPQK